MTLEEIAARYREKRDKRDAEKLFSAAKTRGRNFMRLKFRGLAHIHDEALSRALCKAFVKFDQYDPDKAKFVTWFCTVLRNELFQILKSQYMQKTTDLPEDFELGEADEDKSKDQRLELSEEILAFMRLNPKKHLCHLDYIDGLSYHEIAAKHSINLNSVKTKIARSRQLLNRKFRGKFNALLNI